MVRLVLDIGNVQSDIVAVGIYGVNIGGVLDLARKLPRRVNRQIGVVAIYLHAQLQSSVCNLCADSTETDNAEGLARDLRTNKAGLSLFHHGGDLLALVCNAAHPFNAADHVARCHKQSADNKLLNRLGVCAWGIENGNSLFRAAVNRDVVCSRARSCNAKEIILKLHLQHLRASHHDSVRRFNAVVNI